MGIVYLGSPKVITPAEMASWLETPENNVFEIGDESFYVQEAIGSQQIVLNYPRKLKGNFELSFEMMSLTKQAEIYFVFEKGADIYEVQMNVSDAFNILQFFKNKTLLLEKEIALIEPDVFYNFALAREKSLFTLKIGEYEVLRLEMDEQPITLQMRIVGEPYNPAAVEFMNFCNN